MAEDLIAAGEPAPVRMLRPDGGSDFLLTGDHAGRLIPRALGTLGLDEAERGRHIAWDIGIAAVTEALSERLGATAVLQAYSRLVIDCNRAPDHPTSIPAVSEATAVPGNKDLSDAERARDQPSGMIARQQEIGAAVRAQHADRRRLAGRDQIFRHGGVILAKMNVPASEMKAARFGAIFSRHRAMCLKRLPFRDTAPRRSLRRHPFPWLRPPGCDERQHLVYQAAE